MKLAFRIRRVYFDQIVNGTKRTEVRKMSTYWKRMVAAALREMEQQGFVEGVFVCGKQVHRRNVLDITEHKNARAALGRRPSWQGRQDLGTGPVYSFHLEEQQR